jgi:hypothetical protein
MLVKMLSRVGQWLSRRISRLSVAGDSLPVRLRSTTVGLVGLVAAVGLGLVAMISQQDWPDSINAPLPQAPQLGVVRNDPLVLSQAPRSSNSRSLRSSRVVTTQTPPENPRTAAGGQLGDAQQLGSPANGPTPPPDAPESHPESQGQGSPPPSSAATEPAGADAPAAATEPPAATEDTGPQTAGEPEAPAGEPEQAPSEPEWVPGDSHGNRPPPWAGGGHGPPAWHPGGHGKPSWAGH